MDSLQITTGEIRIPVVRDGHGTGEIVFNPNDVIFAEKFYQLIGEFQHKFTEYKSQADALDKSNKTDGDGIPVNIGKQIELVKSACDYIWQKIDTLFGVGTSDIVFGGTVSLDAIQQFFTGIEPFIKRTRAEKLQRYTNKKQKRVLK